MTITPANMAIGIGVIAMGGTDLGATVGGVRIRQEDTFFDFFCDQVNVVCGKSLTTRRQYVDFTCSEATLANIRRMMNLASGQLVGSTLTFIGTGDTATVTLSAKVKREDGKVLTFTWTKIIRLATGEIGASREGQTLVPMSCEALAAIAGDPPVATFCECVEAAS